MPARSLKVWNEATSSWENIAVFAGTQGEPGPQGDPGPAGATGAARII